MNKKVIDILSPQKPSSTMLNEGKKEIKTEKEFLSDHPAQARAPFFKKGLIFSLVLLIFLGAFSYFTLSKAEIEIWPETEILNLETKLTVDKKTEEPNVLEKIIPAQVFQKEKTLVELFQSSGKILKEKKAEGAIRVYNTYSTSPQVLIANTRFVSVDGKLFRTPVMVTIPGGRYEGGKFIPGEIDIKVRADEPGPEYNIGPSTFSIPGFAGTDKFTKFYGKSFQPMTGGFQEEVSKATREDLARAEDFLTNQVKKECEELLKNELRAEEISAKFDYFLEELRTEIVEKISLVAAEEEVKEFKFQVKAKCETLLFQKEELRNFAKESIVGQIPQGKKLAQESLKIDYSAETVNLNAGKIILALNISAKIYPEVDVYNLKNALAGKSLLETKLFLENQPKITKVNVKLWPFWVRKVPEDLNKIEINIKIE